MDEQPDDEYNHQVDENVKPKEGQEFTSIEEAYDFYNVYAKEAGFSTRHGSNKYRKGTRDLIWKQFLCNKEGDSNDYQKRKLNDDQNDNGETSATYKERTRRLTRCNCDAKLSIVKRKGASNWKVSTFVEGHNHVLATPREVHLLSSHRKISKAKKALTKQFSDANVSTSQQLRILTIQAGGIQNIGFTERDLRNHERDLRKECDGYDADTLFDFFTCEKQKNPAFYFEFDKDEDGRMTRCFWADPVARIAYTSFGDVVVFDTTYNTNKYKMIFAPLMGVNQHRQTIVFGCGFLSDEKIDSFVWLFEQWIKSMLKAPPQIIITDQDAAMTHAIHEALPHTFHRYCIWHIMTKFSDKLEPVNYHKYYSYFQASVYNSDTIEEFEETWKYALQESSLQDHVWLCLIYELRRKWVPAYVNHIFSAGISASQRAESGHCFFKRYVSLNNSLMDFITRFNLALEKQRELELVADWANMNEKPKLKTVAPMEAQMAEVYTLKVFGMFQMEFYQSSAYLIKQVREENNRYFYVVERVREGTSKLRQLVYDKDADFLACTCRLFDFEGIPCRHILAFFRVNQVSYLSEQYIMQRWTRSAKVGTVWDNNGVEVNEICDKALMIRHAKLSQHCTRAIDDASLSEEGTKILRSSVDEAVDKIKELNLSYGDYGATMRNKNHLPENRVISDPVQVRAKGCGSRLKTRKEIEAKKGRLCRTCQQRGKAHDSRNCPLLSNLNDENDNNENFSDGSYNENDYEESE